MTLIASTYYAQDVQIRQPLTNLTVVARPLLNYTYMDFQQVSMIRDVWNESFEGSLTAKNHYWYGAGVTVAEGTVKRNSTLDSGFEEVSSSSLNPNVNLPSWFIHRDRSDLAVKVDRSSTVKYHQSYSAYVETRFVNTSTQGSYSWQTPNSIYDSCGADAIYTIDDDLATEWTHSVQERHWVVYDLGQSYLVKKIRVYCEDERIDDVDIYVSNDPQNFGSKVVELWDPVTNNDWNESPGFYKKGRYIKIEFGTTHFKDWLIDAFYEFDAYVQTSAAPHLAGGLQSPQDYYVGIPYVYLNDTPVFEAALFLDDAGVGDGYCEAFYTLEDIEIQNDTSRFHIVYVVPITTLGFPSQEHFTNTTNTKYIYNVTTISTYDVWNSFTRNVKNDFESIWGQVYDAHVSRIAIVNDFYNPQTDSKTNTPFIKAFYDAVSLKLSSQGNEEELPNGSFEAQGWAKLQENKLQFLNYTKDSSASKESVTSFFMNATGDTSGGSGEGFNSTKHAVVALGESSFIREVNDTNVQRLHGFIKVENFSGVSETAYSYIALRLKFVSLTNSTDIRYLYYCIMLYGEPPSDSSTEKYVELVKFYTLKTGIWYEISRRPIVDGGWENVKITQIALVVAFFYGQSYSSTNTANAVVRFDGVGIDIEREAEITIRESQRSTESALGGNYSLKQDRTVSGAELDIYECGSENTNNTFYVAFPYYTNFSVYFNVSSFQGDATIQISLAVDDGPTYGSGYLYELTYYYGSSSGIFPIFISSPNEVVQISSSITTLSWVHLQKNWTLDLPETWPLTNPRIEAVGLRVWTSNSITVYWDLAAFYGTWYGAEKIVRLQSINNILLKKFNTTENWYLTGDLDPGIDDFVDNEDSDVDSYQDIGSHSNFTNEQAGPDLKYDTLTEAYSNQYRTNQEDYVDNNSSNVDGSSDRGSHSNFTAEQYGPDSMYDMLIEEYLGPGVEIYDYVDNNSSNVDGSPDKGSHSNFTAMQYGPDLAFDTLTEANTNPPPNDAEDYVDNNTSNVDLSPDKGTHSSFTAEQSGPDLTYDTLTEENTNPPPNDVEDYVDQSSNVDGSPDKGSHSNFTAEQAGPDSIYDTLTETFTGSLTNSTEDFVDQMSNVDGVADIGSHSNFTAEQYGPDSKYDVLTEGSTINGTGDWTTPQAVYDLCGEEGGYEGTKTIDENTETDWRHYQKELHWIIYDMGQLMRITKVRIFSGVTPQQYTVENVTVYISNDTTFDSSEIVVTGWNVPKGGWDVSPTFNAIGRYIKLDNLDPTTPNDEMKMAFNEFDAWTEPNYELDLEVQWSNVNYTEVNEELCIYAGTLGTEDLRVDVWNGSAWINILTDIYPGWNNVTVSDYLTNSTFTIRFKGGTETDDTTQDTWEIDTVLLHVWTPDVANYEVDLEVQWTNVDYNELYEELCIYTGNLTSESLEVDYWTGSSWVTLITTLTANSWNNVSVSLTSSTFTIRFKGLNETDDTAQDSWQIDAALLHVWTIQGYQLDLEVQFTNVDNNEENEYLCIYAGNLTDENLHVDIWTGSGWVTVLTDLTANSWNNVSVSDYLNSPTFTIRFKGGYEANEDTAQDSWQIDAVLLHVWTFEGYQIDLEVQFTGVYTEWRDGELRIYTESVSYENLRVDYWTGENWLTLISALKANSWNTASIPLNQTVTIRFKGGKETEDLTQDSWQIDAVLLHTWYIYATEDITRANATSANQWYYKWWGLREFYVINGTGTYEVTGNSTSEGILCFHDNDWNPEDNVSIYNNDMSGYVIYNVTDFELTDYGKNIEYQDYIEIRYTILFCGPLGVFKYTNENRAAAANESDEYGVEYWLLSTEDGMYLDYIESNSSYTITYLPFSRT